MKFYKPSDRIIGLASSGLHSNGYSIVNYLARRLKLNYCNHPELLTPTTIYAPVVKKLLAEVEEVYSYLNSQNISKKVNSIGNLKKFLLKDLSVKSNRGQKLKKRINTMGQSILRNIDLEIKKFIINRK